MFSRTRRRSLLNLRHWNTQLSLHVPPPPTLRFPTANLAALVLCYLVGAYGYSPLLLIPIFLVIWYFWVERHKILVRSVELEAEERWLRRSVTEAPESLEWANFTLSRWWSCCMPTVEQFSKDWIEPIIDGFKLPVGVDSIEILQFNTGPHRPVLSNLRLLEQTTAGSDVYIPVSMATLNRPPGANQRNTSMVFEVDVEMDAKEAEFVLNIRLGSRRYGQNFTMNVERFRLTGRMRVIIQASAAAPFPHLTTAKLSFVTEPVIEVSCRVLKNTIQVFDVPVLRNMVMEYITYGFKKMLVYPGSIDLDFSPPNEPRTEWELLKEESKLAQGVLTVTVCGVKADAKGLSVDTNQSCSLKLGQQKCVRKFQSSREPWSSTFSFLVHDLEREELVVKVKQTRALRKDSVVRRRVELRKLGLQETLTNTPLFRKVSMSSKGAHVILTLCYAPLPPFSLLNTQNPPQAELTPEQNAGVLYVHVHGAKGLLTDPSTVDLPLPPLSPHPLSDSSALCPLCVVRMSDRTVMATRCLPDTSSPVWEQGVEIFIPNYSRMKLMFDVTNQSLKPGSQDHLGSTHLDLSATPPHNIQQQMLLKSSKKLPPGRDPGHLYISTVFRPVESVSFTVNSLIADYVSRTRKHSLANCVDTTTDFLNPAVHGFSSGGTGSQIGYAAGQTGIGTGYVGLIDFEVYEESSEVECATEDSGPEERSQ